MSNKALKQILDEVAGIKLDGSSKVPEKVRPKRGTKMNSNQRDAFVELCKKDQTLMAKLAKLKEDRERVRERLTEIVDLRGRGLVKRPDDRIVFVAPYKAAIQAKSEIGSVDAEKMFPWAEKNAPQMILSETINRVDFHKLDTELKALEMETPGAGDQVRKAMELILKVAKKVEGAVEADTLRHLDLAVYMDMKAADQIPHAVIKNAEVAITSYSALRVDKLTGEHLCEACGAAKPKRALKDKKFICGQCGYTEEQ